MKFKKGDYFIVVRDVLNKTLNGSIGICNGYISINESKYSDMFLYRGEIILGLGYLEKGSEYLFYSKEVKKLSKYEAMIELL